MTQPRLICGGNQSQPTSSYSLKRPWREVSRTVADCPVRKSTGQRMLGVARGESCCEAAHAAFSSL